MEDIPKVFPDLGLPQVVPVVQDLLDEYTKKPENLPIHALDKNLRHIRPSRNFDSLFTFHSRSFPLVQRVKREPATGGLLGYEEVEVSSLGETAKNSLSLTRAPGAKDEGLKGSSTNFPFWPGGFDEEKEILQSANKIEALKINEDEAELFEKLFEKDLLVVPPTFNNGMSLASIIGKEPKSDSETASVDVFAEDRKGGLDFWKVRESTNSEYQPSQAKLAKQGSQAKHLLNEISDEAFSGHEEMERKIAPVLKISKTPLSVHSVMPWAELIDVSKPMADFHEKVPDMAYTYPFELDTFQKHAIAKLEEHENVFVAAHTSAGKTVVAEYAIALSVQHMTRTIYTSPIKALSNQKFRDFKNTFESVGLVTGDVQINPSASVLIMTTEILRSMLYNGSDVIRDLEWVVFDEIHYLNNEERGHVWEEVLIMLPPHVSIIMLSATVPNAMQFANWVGEIKKKKIYVISTLKRPVPLEHYLYTGSGGKSRDEVFLVLDSEGNFTKRGYDDAKEAKLSRMSKHQQSFGARGGHRNTFNENSEKTTYIGLVNHLQKNEKLPVVIFTFSRNRCDQYAQLMSSVDLCTGQQKAEIHGFFMKSISRLKGSDRDLPQVRAFHEMLKNGIGVHHSGILPILKEVVEMLFQKNLVKLLFATETFAMGVNMPARTVVFDSIRKHDGTGFRTLLPAEYIQMAGRAGRRGLDTTGTVIILCKQNIPEITELTHMMTGKAAKLESQFRLTYSMILNLLRVESLTVEDVMKRSFLEATARMKVDSLKEKLHIVQKRAGELEWNHTFDEYLKNFYNDAKNCISVRETLIPFLKNHTRNDMLIPGRIVVVEQLPKYNARFGVILDTIPQKTNPPNRLKVLILTSESDGKSFQAQGFEDNSAIIDEQLKGVEEISRNFDIHFGQMLYFSHTDLSNFQPELNDIGYYTHSVIEVEYQQVLELCGRLIRVDSETIISNIKCREQPRFANDLPPPNVKKVLEELANMNFFPQDVTLIPANQRVVATRDMNLILELQRFEEAKISLKSNNISSKEIFKTKFLEVFSFMKVKDTLEMLEYLLSPKSLRLHEDYQSRIQVLRKLGYIDSDNLVQMKGRVACEMGNQNELMVTEMVLNNMFATAPPPEVAAILSCLVFEAKKVEEPKLDDEPDLKRRVEEVKNLARGIGIAQVECGIKEPAEQYVEQFRFGLAEVVHEWAKGKSFCDIMKLTDVQEGLIVRTIQRLDEMIRDVKDAARIIGDPSLKKKMEESSESIKRDIVFAASLYTQ